MLSNKKMKSIQYKHKCFQRLQNELTVLEKEISWKEERLNNTINSSFDELMTKAYWTNLLKEEWLLFEAKNKQLQRYKRDIEKYLEQLEIFNQEKQKQHDSFKNEYNVKFNKKEAYHQLLLNKETINVLLDSMQSYKLRQHQTNEETTRILLRDLYHVCHNKLIKLEKQQKELKRIINKSFVC